MPRTLVFTLIFFLLQARILFAGAEVTSTFKHQQPNSRLITYSGEILLPFQGYWQMNEPDRPFQATELYLKRDFTEISKEYPDLFKGKSDLNMAREQKIQSDAWRLQSFYTPLAEYAALHEYIGPTSLHDLEPVQAKRLTELNEKKWAKNIDEKLSGEYAFLVPGVPFNPEKDARRRLPKSQRKLLMIELRPYVDDGKHWVLYNDGSTGREKIDPRIVKKYQLEILPITAKDLPKKQQPEMLKYILVMLSPLDAVEPVSLAVKNPVTGAHEQILWDLSKAQVNEEAVRKNLTKARRGLWQAYANFEKTPVLTSWLEFYGDKGGSARRSNGRRGQESNLTAFKVLGGRAAVEETLQLQAIARTSAQEENRDIPIETLQGVEVESHPFADMLQEQAVPDMELRLANLAPDDHLFVYLARPTALPSFLEEGTEFISRFSGVINSNNLQYDLSTKYLSRLGLDQKWLRLFLESGEVEEIALLFPDLFFIDGTDITTISRLAHPQPIKLLLQLIGIAGLSQGNVVEHVLDNGNKVFWTLLDNLLVCSSSKVEMEKVIALHGANGQGSLGKSAEFRYMLPQLPLEKETRIFAYISDPFIRRLVGPATKIAQLRRITGRQNMEALASRILLAKMDGLTNPDSMEALVAANYVPAQPIDSEYFIDRDLRVHSKTYGTLPNMQTLDNLPVAAVTKSEADSYKSYVENYNRYWNRYFDPIAIRIDDKADGSMEMTTFILPLIDNSIYNDLRDMLTDAEGETLQVPQPSLQPVMMLSLNLHEKAWLKINQGLSRYIPNRLTDDLGPSIHLAIHDSDPVIASGSNDILGAFDSELVTGGGRMSMLIPIALSVLTRPCTLFIETSNPEATLAALRGMTHKYRQNEGVRLDFYQIGEKDEWNMTVHIFGTIKLRYGIELQGKYLMIRNIPWSHKEIISGTKDAPLKSAFLEAFPEACKKQLPGLFAAANEQTRESTQKNIAYLYPLFASGSASVENLEQKHFDLFGFRPRHPEGGEWLWDGKYLASSQFGSLLAQKQPPYQVSDDRGGLFGSIDKISLNMQFEDSGLRARLRWGKR